MGRMVDGDWVSDDALLSGKAARFERAETQFRNWVTPDGQAGASGGGGFPAQSGRYHLYVAHACPWAHRALIFRALKGLEDAISVDFVHPIMAQDGWTFDTDAPGATGDRLFGSRYLRDIYRRADAAFSGRVTVPVLWDKERQTIVSNESAEIIRMLNSAFVGVAGNDLDFSPDGLRGEIDAVNARIYHGLNNGVYRAGFAGTQAAHLEAAAEVFETLDWLESRLSKQRYLVGDQATEADWRLAPTLFRFDAVYHVHFKCAAARVVDYPNLWAYARELYQWPGVAQTFDLANTMSHYYGSHDTINPRKLVPMAPRADWLEPHGRGAAVRSPEI